MGGLRERRKRGNTARREGRGVSVSMHAFKMYSDSLA